MNEDLSKATPESHAALLEVHKAFGAFGTAHKIAGAHMAEMAGLHKAMCSKLRAFGKAYGVAEGDALPDEDAKDEEAPTEPAAEKVGSPDDLYKAEMAGLQEKLDKAETVVDELAKRIIALEKIPVQSPIDKAIAVAKSEDAASVVAKTKTLTPDEQAFELTKASFKNPLPLMGA